MHTQHGKPPSRFDAHKAEQQAAWSSGDFGVIGSTLVVTAEVLCETLQLRAGARVLDVATGAGNAAIAAARRWCEVAGIDYAPMLLERARERAAAERLSVTFRDGDAEAIPFPDASFDVVLSTFGAMFAPDHARAAHEMLRVLNPGGAIGMCNWTPEGFAGQALRLLDHYHPAPDGLAPPTLWGDEAHLRSLFGERVVDVEIRRRHFVFRYRSPGHFIAIFHTFYGPAHKAFAALSPAQQANLERDMTALLIAQNRGGNAALAIPAEYLEVVMRKRA